MANSQAEADEWVESIRKLSLYQREDGNKGLSFQRVLNQPLSGTHSPLSSSPPNVHSLPATSRSLSIPPQSVLVSHGGAGNPITIYGSEAPPLTQPPLSQSPQNAQGMFGQLQRSYPTPPESVITLAHPPPPVPHLHKQNSQETANPYPSPPSSDSSSMYSGSNASFDNGMNLDDDQEGNPSELTCIQCS